MFTIFIYAIEIIIVFERSHRKVLFQLLRGEAVLLRMDKFRDILMEIFEKKPVLINRWELFMMKKPEHSILGKEIIIEFAQLR